MNSNQKWREELVSSANYRIDESLRMIDISLKSLDEKDLWKKPNNVSNSVGNLLLHLSGNIRQYIIASLGGNPDTRSRDKEFVTSGGITKMELLRSFTSVVAESKKIISLTTADELLRFRDVQGFTLSGIGVVLHVVEHLSYHTGQIAFWTKLLKESDLGFYDGFDLNQKNN